MAKVSVDMALKVNATNFKDSLKKVKKSIVNLKATIAELEKQEIIVEQFPRETVFDFGMKPIEVTHIKSGAKYRILATNIMNTTNGVVMVLYVNETGSLFVREATEFSKKFALPENRIITVSFEDDKTKQIEEK